VIGEQEAAGEGALACATGAGDDRERDR